jgi:hypothetical protein
MILSQEQVDWTPEKAIKNAMYQTYKGGKRKGSNRKGIRTRKQKNRRR